MVEVFDSVNNFGWKAILVDIDATGVLFYNIRNNTTSYVPFSENFMATKDGKPEDREDED